MQFKNLRGIREDRDIKQKDIAKILNVSQNTYSQYETGVISLTAEVLIKLSDYYNVSIDYLLDKAIQSGYNGFSSRILHSFRDNT